MASKITQSGTPITGVHRVTGANTAKSKSATRPEAGTRAESMPGGLDSLLQELNELIMSAPDVDMARVAELKQALRRGAYRLDPDLIAERLIALEQRLNDTKRA